LSPAHALSDARRRAPFFVCVEHAALRGMMAATELSRRVMVDRRFVRRAGRAAGASNDVAPTAPSSRPKAAACRTFAVLLFGAGAALAGTSSTAETGIEAVRVAAAECFKRADARRCLSPFMADPMSFPQLPRLAQREKVCIGAFRAAAARSSHATTVSGDAFLQCVFEAGDRFPLGNGKSALEGLNACLAQGTVEEQWETTGYVRGGETLCYFELQAGRWKIQSVLPAP
jgi:hypothetical protein